jgi:hypothetical protein
LLEGKRQFRPAIPNSFIGGKGTVSAAFGGNSEKIQFVGGKVRGPGKEAARKQGTKRMLKE